MSLYVVAGATGHIGSVIAHELARRGEKVRAIVRSKDKGAALEKAGVELAIGTLEDTAFLTKTLTGAQGAFLLLPMDMAAPDIRAAQKKTVESIAGAVQSSKIPHVVFLSSLGAELDKGTGPILGLHWAENALGRTGAHVTSLRAGSFMENFLGMLPPAKNGGILPSFLREDFASAHVATRDIGHAAVEELLHPTHKSELVEVIGPAEILPADVAKTFSEILGKPIQLMTVPPAGHLGAMAHAGLPNTVAELFVEMYAAINDGHIVPGRGHRTVRGKTTFPEVLKSAVSH